MLTRQTLPCVADARRKSNIENIHAIARFVRAGSNEGRLNPLIRPCDSNRRNARIYDVAKCSLIQMTMPMPQRRRDFGRDQSREDSTKSYGNMMTRQTQCNGCGCVLQIGHRKYAYARAICVGRIRRGEIILNRMMTMQTCSHVDDANPALRRGNRKSPVFSRCR